MIMSDGRQVGVVTMDALLKGIQGEVWDHVRRLRYS